MRKENVGRFRSDLTGNPYHLCQITKKKKRAGEGKRRTPSLLTTLRHVHLRKGNGKSDERNKRRSRHRLISTKGEEKKHMTAEGWKRGGDRVESKSSVK